MLDGGGERTLAAAQNRLDLEVQNSLGWDSSTAPRMSS